MIHLLLIGACVAALLGDESQIDLGVALSSQEAALLAIGAPLGLWLFAHLFAMVQGRRMDRLGDVRAVRRVERALSLARIGAWALVVTAILGGGWVGAVRGAIGDVPAVDELIAISPFIAVLVLSWWTWSGIERRLREATLLRRLDSGLDVRPIPMRGTMVWYSVRHNVLFVLVPIALLMGWAETVLLVANAAVQPEPAAWVAWVPESARSYDSISTWAPVVQLVGVGVIFSLMPPILRRIWSTTPMPPGALRDRVQSVCDAHRVRVRRLLIWRTGGLMVNAAVMGLLPRVRYVLLSDGLLEQMSIAQIEAVTAHEVGHVRRRHLPWLVVSLMGTMIGLGLIAERFASGWSQIGSSAAALAGVALVFGFVSRRFERQADAFAVQHLSAGETIGPEDAEVMCAALGRVAVLNGLPAARWTWRHGSIAGRQRRLRALVGVRVDRVPIDRQILWIKLFFAAALAGSIWFGSGSLTGP